MRMRHHGGVGGRGVEYGWGGVGWATASAVQAVQAGRARHELSAPHKAYLTSGSVGLLFSA